MARYKSDFVGFLGEHRSSKAKWDGALVRPVGRKQTAHPEKRRRNHEIPPPVEEEVVLSRYEIFVKGDKHTVAPLGEITHAVAARLGYFSWGEPFEATDDTDARYKAEVMLREAF